MMGCAQHAILACGSVVELRHARPSPSILQGEALYLLIANRVPSTSCSQAFHSARRFLISVQTAEARVRRLVVFFSLALYTFKTLCKRLVR